MGNLNSESQSLGPEWFDRLDCARAFGVGTQKFDYAYRRLVGPSSIKRIGKKVYFVLHDLIDAAIREHGEGASSRMPSDDPLLDGSESPGLERYRLARASMAEMELAEKQKVMASTAALEACHARFAASLQSFGEHLRSHYGPAAADAFNRALAESMEAINGFFSDGEGAGGGV